MIVYVPKWLEYAYIFTIKNKKIFYGDYEPSIFDIEEDEIINIIKEPNKDMEKKYSDSSKIYVILNIHKFSNQIIINKEDIIKQIANYFDYSYDKKILHYCEKKEICPFMFIYKLSLSENYWPKEDNKLLIPINNTISTLKYLQASLVYYNMGKKYHKIFGSYSLNKAIYFLSTLIKMEKDFSFISDTIPEVFFLPILIVDK